MPVDYEALRGTGSASAAVPDDGAHTARLDRAALVELDSGSRLVTEWSADGLAWTSWNRFDEKGMQYTQGLLDGLGVDRSTLTDDDALEAALSTVQGTTYLVTTKSQEGRLGDRWFTTTYVDARAVADPDLVADTSDLPDAQEALAVEGDVPF